MTLSSRERAELRSQAHHLPVTVHVGHQGVTDAVRQTLDDALRTHELVKVQFSKNYDGRPKHVAGEVAAQVDAEVVQAIGRTITLYRENPDLEGSRSRPKARARE